MVYIITSKKTGKSSDFHTMTIDQLHDRRKKREEEMKDGILSKDQMNMIDCKDATQEEQRVKDYDKWKDTPGNGVTNNQRMKEWSDINREFKKRGEEGRVHTMDDVRSGKNIKYD